jgi:hypothetical protein
MQCDGECGEASRIGEGDPSLVLRMTNEGRLVGSLVDV